MIYEKALLNYAELQQYVLNGGTNSKLIDIFFDIDYYVAISKDSRVNFVIEDCNNLQERQKIARQLVADWFNESVI